MGAAFGSVAGGIAGALTTPLDVLKTRIMLQVRFFSWSPRSARATDAR